ncbi:uncharacterized protein LOC130558557 isoform X2 [Triplophysa rosa]|uniref:uncharacterized protein LOC130558557 isoform X2 n=1 Tax=Triplophysa rosa TaxID=992332 RepID=UPI002546327A|nr:uncharacterized protein LOC130558557 isoform X2 [Triplophysa rosa]XP_057197012.1 uncharacterized protein LOC130558557 isoform X2 [Triplophysa rosa]XP_057197013.1 uncharacterized protein LOC130558557 isoform X2 [Triplophysa rosa]
MSTRRNARNVVETYFDGQHLSLYDLKEEEIDHRYLFKNNIPAYPESVEFDVKKVSHVTGRRGLEGIFEDLGFRQPSDTSHFLWWELSVTADDIRSAEERFLTSLFPRTRIRSQLPFLEYFTTSKAFQKESPYGNFRFTFSIRELLYHYGDQFCPGHSPVLRVYETVLYRREILYTIVVHPRYITLYDDYPRLPNDGEGVCGYANGSIWWRCQAPSETYKHRFNVNWKHRSVHVSPRNEQYYMWDHVCVAFHMEPGWVLHMNRDKLINRVNVCEVSAPCLLNPPETPLSLNEAKNILTNF